MSYSPIDSSVLTAVLNNQGTQATSAYQSLAINNQGTQASESTLAKVYNSFGTLAASGTKSVLYNEGGEPIETYVDTTGEAHLGVSTIQSVYASTKNSSVTVLGASGSFVGTKESTLGIAGIQVMLKTDQNCTVYIDQSGDSGTNWDVSDSYNYIYSKGGTSWTTQAVGTDFRIRVYNSNTTTPTSYFRLGTALCPIVEAVPRSLSTNGYFLVDVKAMLDTFGSQVKGTPIGEQRVAQSTRLIGAGFVGTTLDTNFWTSTTVGTGNITQANNQVTIATGATASSSGTLVSARTARYVSGHSNYYRGVVRAPAVTGANTRRWGAYNTTDGFFFEIQNGVLAVVCRKTGSDANKVVSTSWNGDGGTYYVLDENVHTFEIYWTNKSAWFLIDDVIVHKFSGLTSPLTDSNSLPITSKCSNTAGNTADNKLEVRVASINRLGQLMSQPILKNITTPAPTVLKYGAGNIHRVMVCTAGTSGVKLAVYDATSIPATSVNSFGTLNVGVGSSNTISGQGNFVYDYGGAPFYNGLTVLLSGPADINVIYE